MLITVLFYAQIQISQLIPHMLVIIKLLPTALASNVVLLHIMFVLLTVGVCEVCIRCVPV